MLVLARRDERSREEAEAKALGAKTLGAKALETKAPETKAPKAKALEAKAPKAKALETEALEAKEDEGGGGGGSGQNATCAKEAKDASGRDLVYRGFAGEAGRRDRAGAAPLRGRGAAASRAHGQRLSPLRCGGCGAAAADSAAAVLWALSAPFATPSLMTVSISVRCSPTTLPRCARGKKNWKL